MNKIYVISNVTNKKKKTEAEELYDFMLAELAELWAKRNRISNPNIVLILDMGLLTIQDAIVNFRKVDVSYAGFIRYNKLCESCMTNCNYRFDKHELDNKLKCYTINLK